MTFLPIVERELKVAVKRPSTYWGRCLTAGIAIMLALSLMIGGAYGLLPLSASGGTLFILLAAIGYVYVVIQGPLLAADALSGEKRNGTLGLLFLTDLKGHDVVLGKLASFSIHVISGLVAAFPAPAVAFLIGGVSFSDYMQMMLVLLNTLFFSLSLSLCVSAASRNPRRAFFASLAGVFFFCFGLPALSTLGRALLPGAGTPGFLLALSPAGAFMASLKTGGPILPNSIFGLSFWFIHVWAWIFLLGASLILPRAWQDKEVRSWRMWSREKWDKWKKWMLPQPLEEDRALTYSFVDPVVRFVQHSHRRLEAFWIYAIVASLFLPFVLFSGYFWFFFFTCLVIGHYVLKFEMAILASRTLAADMRSGVLELLLTTPLEPREIVAGRLIAFKRLFFWPLMILLGAGFALFLNRAFFYFNNAWNVIFWLFITLIYFFCNVALLHLVAWYGLWQGLKTGHPALALRRTIGILLMDFASLLCILGIFFSLLNPYKREAVVLPLVGAIYGGFTLLLGAPSVAGEAMSKLYDEFRSRAAGEPVQKSERIKKFLDKIFARFKSSPAPERGKTA